MPMSDFFQMFPKLAESELRNLTIGRDNHWGLPAGRYAFIEAYCNEKGCDCRRVIIAVFLEETREYVAHINMGFDSSDGMAGPFLDPMDPQGPHARQLLAFFTDMVNRDPDYLKRLQRHYVQFKERLEARRYTGRRFEDPGRVMRVAAKEPPGLSFPDGADTVSASAPVRREAGVGVGHNDPCPCGSGKKYKRCCLGIPQADPDDTAADRESRSRRRPSEESPGAPLDDLALNRRAADLIAAVARWRRNPMHQERWAADVQERLELEHAQAFPLLQLLLTRYGPDGRQQTRQRDYSVCLDLLEEALTQIRYSVERNRPTAIAMAEQLQTAMAERGFKPEVDVRVQQDLIMALHGAKLALHPGLRDKAAEVADYYARFSAGKGARDLDNLLKSLVRETKPKDAFDLLGPVAAQAALMSVEDQITLAARMLASSQTVLNELAVLMLLHPDAQVRTRLPARYRDSGCLTNWNPVGLRRLIGLRNWLPSEEHAGVDALIEAVRLAGISGAPLPRTVPIGVHASPFDGAGSQAASLVVMDRRRYRIENVLVRQGDGVRDAFSKADLNRRECDDVGRRMGDGAGMIPVDGDYLHRLLSHFIAVGLDRGAPPLAQLLLTNEWFGGGYWTPERVSPADEIDRLEADFSGSVIAKREQGVLTASGKWPGSEPFAVSWFEDDARVEQLLHERVGGPGRWMEQLPQAASVIIDGVMERKRDVWIERLLWMALWSGACPKRPPLPWRAFLVIARVLQRGVPMAEIPMMQAVAERSVQSAWQRSFRR